MAAGPVVVNANGCGRELCGQAADFTLKLQMVVENPRAAAHAALLGWGSGGR